MQQHFAWLIIYAETPMARQGFGPWRLTPLLFDSSQIRFPSRRSCPTCFAYLSARALRNQAEGKRKAGYENRESERERFSSEFASLSRRGSIAILGITREKERGRESEGLSTHGARKVQATLRNLRFAARVAIASIRRCLLNDLAAPKTKTIGSFFLRFSFFPWA